MVPSSNPSIQNFCVPNHFSLQYSKFYNKLQIPAQIRDQGTVESNAQQPLQSQGHEEGELDGLDLPAIREIVQFMKTGRLDPEPSKKVPKFSANRVQPYNSIQSKCNHSKDCKNCQDSRLRAYNRQYRIIKRAEDSAAVMTTYTRELQKQNEELKRQNEELKRQNEDLQRQNEELRRKFEQFSK